MGNPLAIQGGKPVRAKLFPSWPVWDDTDAEAVAAVVRSGRWGRLNGDRVEAFEQAFAAFQGAAHGVAVVNGSVALRLALLAVGIEAGDEVIVPPYTFLATATSVIECNATPVFADIDPDTYCLDPEAFAAAITPRTRAVIPVHLGGQAAAMERILTVARERGIAVIEDAAHAHGATYGEKGLGSLGDLGAFSFQSSKNLTAGEGGIVLTNHAELAAAVRALHHCGRRSGGQWYEHTSLGGNYRLSELQGALLLSQMRRLADQTQRRNANGLYLNARLGLIPGILPLARGRGETLHAYHLYVFRYDAETWGVPRAAFVRALRAEGIPASEGYTIPLYRQGLFRDRAFGPYTGYTGSHPDLDYGAVHCPVCERACGSEGCWLPQSLLLGNRRDMDSVVRAVAKLFEHRGALRQATE
ncbi:MAG: DegT/DnrJ/EryC1/StrS family aminotransferase [Lentisphaeria bacterium]|nr:DegT/DnrJ/EryC1/StrS family aminotransferase [Lentisphaeria bacterium]